MIPTRHLPQGRIGIGEAKRGDQARASRILSAGTTLGTLRWKLATNDANQRRLPMMKKILAASVLTLALATSGAMAQSSGTGGGTGSGNVTSGTGGTSGGATGGGTVTTPNPTTDNTTTNSTQQPSGMNDRCKDVAGNDTDNNTASGATTSNMQNCNK